MATPDPRNLLDAPRARVFELYVGTVTAAGLVAVGLVLGRLDLRAVPHLSSAFWLVCALLLAGELRPLFTSGTRDPTGLVVSTPFVLALLLRHGLPAALLLQVVSTVVSDVSKGKALWRTAFNVGQYALAWTAAAAVLGLGGPAPSLAVPASLRSADLPLTALAALAFFALNELLVTRALALRHGTAWWRTLREDVGYDVLTTGTLLALAPLVVLAMERGVAFVPLLVPPLVALHVVAAVALDREEQARTDALTGLPNRRALAECATRALAEHDTVGLVLFDLDRFKEVNDTLGHHVGDRLLQVVAERLAGAVRDDDVVGRLGGDEFALVLPGVSGVEAARETAERVRGVLSAPILLEGLLVDVGASAGVVVSPVHGDEVDLLLQRADVAMYLAKDATGVEVYDPERDRHTTGRLTLLGELRKALAGDELELHYQPKADLLAGTVVGVEALVRWRHPERGLVPPDDFVPLAERSGLVQDLTAWVLDEALAQQARWTAQGLDLRMAVNVSVKDLCGGVLADVVSRGLDRHGVAPSRLQLEVTEGSLFADPVRAASTLTRLGELGVELSLDDFGTGYSSLGHLRSLPVQELKVDRSFVGRLDDARDLAIVRSVVDLGRGLGMHVVAEGVEDAQAWARLAALGCDSAQGWYLARPQPADVLTPWLRDRMGDVRAGAARSR